MVGPLKRKKMFWTVEEDQRLINALNRHFESLTQYKCIETDEDFGFEGVRSNVDIKDRLRLLYDSLKPYHSFLIPENCNEPKNFIPREYWHILDNETEERQNIPLLPENKRSRLKLIVKRFTTKPENFLKHFRTIPRHLEEDPVKTVPTWNVLCNTYFKARNKLSYDGKNELLYELIENGILKKKVVGVRTYVYRT